MKVGTNTKYSMKKLEKSDTISNKAKNATYESKLRAKKTIETKNDPILNQECFKYKQQ